MNTSLAATVIHWICLAGCVAAAVMAVAVMLRYWRDTVRYREATTRWRQSHAQILSCALKVTSAGQTLTRFHRHPALSYTYIVDGAHFEGRRIFLTRRAPFETLEEAQDWQRAHAPGCVHPVWFDPMRPSLAALELNAPNLQDVATSVIVLLTLSAALALIA